MATGLIAASPAERAASMADTLRMVCGMFARITLTPEESPTSYRLLPQIAGGDLWRNGPRLLRHLARHIDAGHISNPGVCSDQFRALATMIERGAKVADIEDQS